MSVDYSFTGPAARAQAVKLYGVETTMVNNMIAEIQTLLKHSIDTRTGLYVTYTIRHQHLRRQLFRRLLQLQFNITVLQSGRIRVGFK